MDKTKSWYNIKQELKNCQDAVLAWGKANRVQFDPGKEHVYILDTKITTHEDFEILGATFDMKLKMNKEIFKVSCEVSRKKRALVRVWKFYSTCALIRLYKAHVLPYAERSIPAIFHVPPNSFECLDHVQVDFLHELQVFLKDVLLTFNLAPLSTRRDISMLGLLHRTQLSVAPLVLSIFPQG